MQKMQERNGAFTGRHNPRDKIQNTEMQEMQAPDSKGRKLRQ